MMTATLRPDPAVTANRAIADGFDAVARLLESQSANPFRVQAYRDGAATLRRLRTPASDIFVRRGLTGLEQLPGIGPALARAIRDAVITGRVPMLERLRGARDPVAILASIPGIGETLAERLYHELHIRTLEELEAAVQTGRMEHIAGIGPKKLHDIQDALALRLGPDRAPIDFALGDEPPVEELLDVDREYRRQAAGRRLPRIAPQRFNPEGRAWLPVLHTHRGPRQYTAMFSNTARAHRRGRASDWVVLSFDGPGRDHECTVATAEHGPLRGRRVVRGREDECARLFATRRAAS